MSDRRIEPLDAEAARAAIPALSEILIDCVDGGASVGFLAPLAPGRAAAFWALAADGVARGDRILLVARDSAGQVHGTVQVAFAQPENQPHRADVSKLLVHRRCRRTGAGEALMRHAEQAALAAGRTLLVLDTATTEAERIYQRLGWQRCGVIPNYALNPDRSPCDTVIYYKSLV